MTHETNPSKTQQDPNRMTHKNHPMIQTPTIQDEPTPLFELVHVNLNRANLASALRLHFPICCRFGGGGGLAGVGGGERGWSDPPRIVDLTQSHQTHYHHCWSKKREAEIELHCGWDGGWDRGPLPLDLLQTTGLISFSLSVFFFFFLCVCFWRKILGLWVCERLNWLLSLWVYFFDLFMVWFGFLDLFLVFLDLME